MQDNESIMCGFHCIVFMEYMHAGKTCRKTVGIKRYKPIIKKKKKKHDQIVLLGKDN